MGCQGISAPVSEAPPAPPSSLTLVSAGLSLSHIFSPFCVYSCHYVVIYFPLLNLLSPKCYHLTDGLGLGQWWVHLGASWLWLSWTWGKFQTRSHPCSSPPAKLWHASPVRVDKGVQSQFGSLAWLMCSDLLPEKSFDGSGHSTTCFPRHSKTL